MKINELRFNEMNKILNDWGWNKDTQLMSIFHPKIQSAVAWVIEYMESNIGKDDYVEFDDWMKTGYEDRPHFLVEVTEPPMHDFSKE